MLIKKTIIILLRLYIIKLNTKSEVMTAEEDYFGIKNLNILFIPCPIL